MEWINTLATIGSALGVYFALKIGIKKDVVSLKEDIVRIDERLFQVAIGRSLKDVLKKEKEKK